MAKFTLEVDTVLDEKDALTNNVFVNPSVIINVAETGYLKINKRNKGVYIFRVDTRAGIDASKIGISAQQRKWTDFNKKDKVECVPFKEGETSKLLGCAVELDFQFCNMPTTLTLNTDEMAFTFRSKFIGVPFNMAKDDKKQELLFEFRKMKYKITVMHLYGREFTAGEFKDKSVPCGILQGECPIFFTKAEKAKIELTGTSKGTTAQPKFPDLAELGIGGLEKQFWNILRRISATRHYPEWFVEQYGIKHVRGIMLYGPPGTGKTLMARKIGELLNARKVTVINGPSIMRSLVGESAKLIRNMFGVEEDDLETRQEDERPVPENKTPTTDQKLLAKIKTHTLQMKEDRKVIINARIENYLERKKNHKQRKRDLEQRKRDLEQRKNDSKITTQTPEARQIEIEKVQTKNDKDLNEALKKLNELEKTLNDDEKKLNDDEEKLNKQEKQHNDEEGNSEVVDKRSENKPSMYVYIFDEMDAVCKRRGCENSGASQVNDSMVSQLLTILDGVTQYNNILVIGTTNRRDVIDEALLRPGRFEVQEEIFLPDEGERLKILAHHTRKMRQTLLDPEVNIEDLAKRTNNSTGAELEGLIKSAQSRAMWKLHKVPESGFSTYSFRSMRKADDDLALHDLKITREDFEDALQHDFKPAYGTRGEELDEYRPKGIIEWGKPVERVLENGAKAVNRAKQDTASKAIPVAMLLVGPRNSGKTALAVEIARRSEFPFIKMCTTKNMIGLTGTDKCMAIKKIFDDAYKSRKSAIILDDIEGLINYSPHGPRSSELVTQCIMDLLCKQLPMMKRMVIIGTSSCPDVLHQLGLLQCFVAAFEGQVRNLTEPEEVNIVLKQERERTLSDQEIEMIRGKVALKVFDIGIKVLLEDIAIMEQYDKLPDEKRVEEFLKVLRETGALNDRTT